MGGHKILRQITALQPIAVVVLLCGCSATRTATEFCLEGEFDLGARYQGMRPAAGERYPARFCYTVEEGSDAVMFAAEGKSNPDVRGDWSVSYLPPDKARIVNRESPPDIEFAGKSIANEALRHRRTDPRQLIAEIERHPEWVAVRTEDGGLTVQYPGSPFPADVRIADGRLQEFTTLADMPLRGRVPVVWRWHWPDDDSPQLTLLVQDEVIFKGTGSWRMLDVAKIEGLWQLSGGMEPIAVPGDRWPATINLSIEELTEGVHFVKGVRTGFGHIVIETGAGLVVGDAPAGWVELHQLPPADLVPGYGISGLSENFIDFLHEQFPDIPIHAVAITHGHDDHAGGARAFAAAGATVYAPAGTSEFLDVALNQQSMPDDRLRAMSGNVRVTPVADRITLAGGAVELVALPRGPHVNTALGVWAKSAGVFFQSDLHVPRSDDDAPHTDRAATECWFADWAVTNLPADTIVVNSHSSPKTPVSRHAKYLDSESCRSR